MAEDVKASEADTLSRLVQWFEEAEWETIDARKQSEIDRDYYDSKQWTKKERKILEGRNQPVLTINKIKDKINFLTGNEKQARVDPRAFPRNAPHDEEASEAATDGIRFVIDKEDGPNKFSDAAENMFIEGFGGIEVIVEKKRGQNEISLKQWPWDRLFYDPHSSRHDFSDAKYKGGVIWMDAEDAKAKWPNKTAVIESTVQSAVPQEGTQSDTLEDKPRHQMWAHSGKRNRIRVVQIYWKKGEQWFWAIYTKGGFLEGNTVVPFVNDEGDSECPLIMQSAYVDRENNRYGEVRPLRDIQDEINKRRSKLLHQLSVRQIRAEKGAIDNIEKTRKELARADGVLETNPGLAFEIIDQSQQIQGQALLLQDAKDDMQADGANAALQGKQGQEASGRAILASQQGGLVTLTTVMDRFRNLKLRTYKQIWNRIRQFWTEERWVRVTDNEDNVKFVGFNRPLTQIEAAVKEAEAAGMPEAEIAQMVEFAQQNPESQEIATIENVPAEMDMDIIIEEVPDTITIQQEQFDQIATMAASGIGFSPKTIIKASSLRNKEELLEEIDGGGELTPEQQEAAQQQQQLEQRAAIAEVVKLEAEAKETQADALKTEQEARKLELENDVAELQVKSAILAQAAE